MLAVFSRGGDRMLYQATVVTRQSLRDRETALRASAGDIVATRGFRAAP